MAGNDWINSYLEAILDVGPGLDDPKKSSLLLRERGHFSPTRYFVEEVITGFDETDLHRSWIRVLIYISIFNSKSFYYLSLSLSLSQIHSFQMFRLRPPGVHRRETPDWRTCVGGFGIWLAKRSRSFFFIFNYYYYFNICFVMVK